MGEYQGSGIPLALTVEALEPSKSKDEISVHYEHEWSELRHGRTGRPMYCYVARNITKGNQYEVEFFEDDEGQPWSFCSCPASKAVCKHQRSALKDLLVRVPEFGKSVFGGETNE